MSIKTSQKSLLSFTSSLNIIIAEMKKYPFSFILYIFPSIVTLTFALSLVSFINNFDVTNPSLMISKANILLLILLLQFFVDSLIAHIVYSQYKEQKPLLSILLPSLLTFHIYLLHRVILHTAIFSPILILIALASLISIIHTLFLETFILTLFLFILLIIAFVVSISAFMYISLAYSYLPVSIYFSKSKSLLKLKEYQKVVTKNKKNIILKIVILLAIILCFQTIHSIYEFLIQFISKETLSLIFKAIGVIAIMIFSYFINSYFYFTYQEIIAQNSKKTTRKTSKKISKK